MSKIFKSVKLLVKMCLLWKKCNGLFSQPGVQELSPGEEEAGMRERGNFNAAKTGWHLYMNFRNIPVVHSKLRALLFLGAVHAC